MTFVADLAPEALWGHFDTILTIPRGSKNEARMREYVLEVAGRTGLAHDTDADMVNEKNSDVAHDFTRDPIRPRREGDYLKATGTTLGSDNGVGVAAMLALAEATDLAHGPLELLFTVDEESGLTGAAQLDGGMLRGTRLINLDSEEEGVLYVGCAGGGDSVLAVPVRDEAVPAGAQVLRVGLAGLRGGHSGVDIHLQRGNAIQLLARALWSAAQIAPVRLAGVAGGSAHNAIPREASATVVVDGAERERFGAALRVEMDAVRAEFAPADPDLRCTMEDGETATAWDEHASRTVLELLNSLPHGVLAMSYAIPDLVETSTNLAKVATRDGTVVVKMSSRSSVDSALEALRRRIRATAGLAGAAVEEDEAYPGWKPDLGSPLLAIVQRVHETALGRKPGVKAIHAGLECGIIGKKVPGLDMISFGPQIEFPHSPDERVHVASVGRFYELLTAVLDEMA
jgi:dipeptidase D